MFHLRTIAQRLLLPLLFVSGVAAGLTSCSNDEEDSVVPKEEITENDSLRQVEVEFYLNVGSLATRSSAEEDSIKAHYPEEDVEGSEWENYIDTSTLHFYLLNDITMTNQQIAASSNGNNAGTFLNQRDITVTSVKRVNSSGTYKVYGKCTLPTSNFRVMAIANWPNAYSGTTANLNFTNLVFLVISHSSATYEYKGQTETFIPSATNTFPMYGIKYYNFTENNFAGKSRLDLGTITLVRAMAKIVVKGTAGTTITSATLTRCNNRGRCAPYQMYKNTVVPNEDLTDGYNNTTNASYVFTSTGSIDPVTDVPFRQVNDSTYVIYVPEYFNNMPPNTWGYDLINKKTITPTRIALTFSYKTKKDGEEVTVDDPTIRYVDFKKNQDDLEYFSILRNHMYIFTVRYYVDSALFYQIEDMPSFTADTITFD